MFGVSRSLLRASSASHFTYMYVNLRARHLEGWGWGWYSSASKQKSRLDIAIPCSNAINTCRSCIEKLIFTINSAQDAMSLIYDACVVGSSRGCNGIYVHASAHRHPHLSSRAYVIDDVRYIAKVLPYHSNICLRNPRQPHTVTTADTDAGFAYFS
jgi:hypothetical protein